MALAQERTYTIDDIYALPDGERAELIDGDIYYMAPQSVHYYNTRFYDLFQVDFPLIDNNKIKGCKTRNCNASYRALRG